MINILLGAIITLVIFVGILIAKVSRIQERLDTIDAWADTVDEFIDGEYIILDLEDKQ